MNGFCTVLTAQLFDLDDNDFLTLMKKIVEAPANSRSDHFKIILLRMTLNRPRR